MPAKRMLINFPASKAAVHDALRRTAQEMGVSMTRVVIEAVERFTKDRGAGIVRRPRRKGEPA